jgi:hypothetical protein
MGLLTLGAAAPIRKSVMAMSEVRQTQHRPSLPRLWIRETLVVFGVLAFGYYAIVLEGTPQPSPQTTEQPPERR